MGLMDIETAQLLCQINNEFYALVSDSFSATRQAPWTGWQKCVDILEQNDVQRIVDIACGNLRFEAYAFSRLGSLQPHLMMYAVDDCIQLLPEKYSRSISFSQLDVVDTLLSSTNTLAQKLNICDVDVAVSFGFMHHIPGLENRIRFLHELLDIVKPKGYVMVSLWQFMNHEALAKKAYKTHQQALEDLCEKDIVVTDLEPGDYFLGWKDEVGVYRYCHHFSDDEVTFLVQSLADCARVCAQFNADGRSENLNMYLVLQKMK